MRKLWTRLFPRGVTGLFAALLLLLILTLQYGAGLLTINMVKLSKERELGTHLQDLGTLAPSLLGKPALRIADLAFDARFQASPGLGTTTATTALQFFREGLDNDMTDPFLQFVSLARLDKIVLLAADGHVLYDTQETERALESYDFWGIDHEEIQQARQGEPTATLFYTASAERPIKRLYTPIYDEAAAGDGAVRALLCLVAGADYLEGISQLNRRLLQINLLLTILMGGVGLLIYSLLRRQRRYERQAAEADRLAGLGSLAAGFAHELRNPLEIIRAFTEDLERSLQLGAPLEESIEACQEIVEEVDRMNRLVGQFLSYSRGTADVAAPGVTPVLETIQSVLTMLRPSAEKARLTLTLEHPGAEQAVAQRWAVALDSGGFRQILLNLTLNAIQSSPAGATVSLMLMCGARRVELRIQDQGPGIPEKDRGRIFEPFFSTRTSGSGLGLAISRQIADRAGGSLKLAQARPGQGACFVLSLPRTKDTGSESIKEASGVKHEA